MPSESRDYDELRDEFERLEAAHVNLQTAWARLEGEMIYMRGALARIENHDAAEASAALEVRKKQALAVIDEHTAQRNHRRELAIKCLVILTTIATIVGAILGT